MDWDREGVQSQPPLATQKKWNFSIRWLFSVFALILILFNWNLENRWAQAVQAKPNPEAIQKINNIINPETIGGFESWSEGDISLPYGWNGPHVQQEKNKEWVKSGTSSARVWADNISGVSLLDFLVRKDEVYFLIGKNIQIEAWVKSKCKIPEKVFISFADPSETNQHIAKYQNSGKWEKLSITRKIPETGADNLMLRLWVYHPTCPAYFDGISLRYAPNNPGTNLQ